MCSGVVGNTCRLESAGLWLTKSCGLPSSIFVFLNLTCCLHDSVLIALPGLPLEHGSTTGTSTGKYNT